MPQTDLPATSKSDIYSPNRVQRLAVKLPEPYKTFKDVEEY
jgi:hypothetical protein